MSSGLAVLLLSVVAAGSVLSQALMKRGVSQMGGLTLEDLLHPGDLALRMLQTPLLWLGLAVAGVVLLLWLVVLSRLELSLAGALLGAGYYLLLGLGSWLLLGEQLPAQRVLGLVVISVGVGLVAWRN